MDTITLYQASSPKVEASTESIMTVTAGMATDLHPLLEKHGLDSLKPGEWVNQQKWLDFMKELAEAAGAGWVNLISIGMEIANEAKFPPHIDSLESALGSLNDAYHMNNRNDSPERGWVYEKVDDNDYSLTCRTAVPRDFEYGVVYGLAKRFRAEGQSFTVERKEQEDGSCLFNVKVT